MHCIVNGTLAGSHLCTEKFNSQDEYSFSIFRKLSTLYFSGMRKAPGILSSSVASAPSFASASLTKWPCESECHWRVHIQQIRHGKFARISSTSLLLNAGTSGPALR